MLALPLTGWALVSTSPLGLPTVLFGMVTWPHLPVLSTLGDKAPVEAALKWTHAWGAWLLLALLAAHIGAALRHGLMLRDAVLGRMLPGLGRPR